MSTKEDSTKEDKTTRLDPFSSPMSLDDFTTKQKSNAKIPTQTEGSIIDQLAKDNNFPSRQATRKETAIPIKQQRRFRTGRNQQINIKATEQTIEKLYDLADKNNIPLGELLSRALNAFENLNIKASEQTINRFNNLVNKANISPEELLSRALNALENQI